MNWKIEFDERTWWVTVINEGFWGRKSVNIPITALSEFVQAKSRSVPGMEEKVVGYHWSELESRDKEIALLSKRVEDLDAENLMLSEIIERAMSKKNSKDLN